MSCVGEVGYCSGVLAYFTDWFMHLLDVLQSIITDNYSIGSYLIKSQLAPYLLETSSSE